MGILGRLTQGAQHIGRTAGAGLGGIGRLASKLLQGAGSAAKKVSEIGQTALQLAESIPLIKNIPLVGGLIGAAKSTLGSMGMAGTVAGVAGSLGSKLLTSNFEKIK